MKSDVKSVAAGKGEDAQTNLSSTQERYHLLLNGTRFKYVFHLVNGLYTFSSTVIHVPILKGFLRSILSEKSNKDDRYTKMARMFPHALFGTKIGYAADAGQRPQEMGF